MRKFYILHHSHTDVGYTERQEKLERYHARYLETVVDILRSEERCPQWKGFHYIVENFWMLERFLRMTDEDYRKDFWDYVRQGRIGLSGSYLNGTDLVDDEVLKDTLKRCHALAAEQGVKVESTMTADINGYPWNYVSIQAEMGVKYLLSALNTHHGHYTAGARQVAFRWEGPDGRSVLVWQGEHYNLGNYFQMDGITPQFEGTIEDGLSNTGLTDEELSTARIFEYAKALEDEGYPFDFAPIMCSGLRTDNAPPGAAIAAFINRWNEKHGHELKLEMATLDTFFAAVEDALAKGEIPIPTYRGDWTDWWADGTCSTPAEVAHYRDAVRKYRLCRAMDPDCRIISAEELDKAREDLMVYSEHTWGFSAYCSHPFHRQVAMLEFRQTLYAARANETLSRLVDDLQAHYGEKALVLHKDYRLHALNPNPVPVKDMASTGLEILFGHEHFKLVEEATGKEVPCQISDVPRGKEFSFITELEPFEHKVYRIVDVPAPEPFTVARYKMKGDEQVADFHYALYRDPDWVLTERELVTPFFHVRWEMELGITSIEDLRRSEELVEDSEVTAFQPIYEVTPIQVSASETRRLMGRNRKTPRTLRDYGSLVDVKILEKGPVFNRVALVYEMEGSRQTELVLTAYRDLPKLDVDLLLHKETHLEPENVYLALPFGMEDAVLYADKMGVPFRPRIDQIPGSCADFYALESGLAWVSAAGTVEIAMKDAPMISMGTLEAHDIYLAGDRALQNDDEVYAWVMNNFWETNFKIDLGGFYNMRYTLRLTDETDPRRIFDQTRADNTGVLSYSSFDVEK